MPGLIDSSWVSRERFAGYLAAADGDTAKASRLYEWNAEASSALFELLHHFEVLFKNAVIAEIDTSGISPQLPPGAPWVQGAKQVQEVIGRLHRQAKTATAARVYANLSFGFWRHMFIGPYSEEMWRHTLRRVFRHSRADRSVIADYLESVNQLRNRIAHHGTVIDLDIDVELQKILRLAGWIDPTAAAWLRGLQRVSSVSAKRPVAPARDVIVVAATDAWPLYDEMKQHAYVFPAGRSIKVSEYIAFYADQEIKPIVPRITHRFDAVDWNDGNARRLIRSSGAIDQRLGRLIAASRTRAWQESVYRVFLLSGPTDPETVVLPHPIDHSARGRGSAFVRSHRYLSRGELLSAFDTSEIAHG